MHTRIGDYVIRYANKKGVDRFIEYLEARRFDIDSNKTESTFSEPVKHSLDKDVENFLKNHNVGVLSTIDRTGNVHGATIYYYINQYNQICMLTKSSTQKARNIFANQQVAFTVFNANTVETVQLQGTIELISDPNEQREIYNELTKPRIYAGEIQLPPITKIHDDSYVSLHMIVNNAKYVDYRKLT